MISKFKDHVKRHKTFYLCAGTGCTVAGITWYIMRDQSLCDHLRGQRSDATTFVDNSQAITESLIFDSHIGPVTNNYDTAKRLSYIISQDGTDNWWRSQSDASQDLGISETRLSSYFNHGDPLPGDISLTREGIAV